MAQDGWKKETDETECQTPEGPTLCANNCGFFGSAVTNNLCSKCYRDLFMKQQLLVTPAVPVVEKIPSIASTSILIEPAVEMLDKSDGTLVASVDVNPSEEMREEQQPANRCLLCRKRVGLTGFKCRCGGTFCSAHRYSETHECSFDYRTAGQEAIAKENPVVKANKIEKI